MKVQTIQFEVDQAKGELPFRTYVSSKPVNNRLFMVISKLDKNNNVFFQLYIMETKTGEATVARETTVTQDQFTEIVQAVENDLKTVDATVEFTPQYGNSIAISSHEGVLKGDEDLKAFVLGVMTKQISKEKSAEIFMNFSREQKLEVLSMMTAAKGGPENMHPLALIPLARMLTALGAEEGCGDPDCENCGTKSKAPEGPKVHPSNRISKYL